MASKQRSIWKALLMGVIPLLHIILFYKWCNEAKVHWKARWLNSTIYAFLFLIPAINIYPLFKFLTLVESGLSAEGKKGYWLPPLALSIAASTWALAVVPPICPIVVPFAWLVWLYIAYRTQSLFNENGVKTL